MKTTDRFPLWLWAAVAATVLLSLLNLVPRIKSEQSNKAVALAVEITAAKQLAGPGVSVQEALTTLSQAGVNMVVLHEQTLGELRDEGRLQITSTAPGFTTVLAPPSEIERLKDVVRDAYPALTRPGFESSYDSLDLVTEPNLARQILLGIDPEDVRSAQAAGMEIVARYFNRPQNRSWPLDQAKSLGVKAYLPIGDSVIGFQNDLDETREALAQNQILYLSPEFANIFGDGTMRKQSPENTVRLHTAQTPELALISQAEGVERYAKAFRERNVRTLLVRPRNPSGGITEFAEFVRQINRSVASSGGAVRPPRPFDPVVPNPLLAGLLGLGLVPVFYLVATALLPQQKLAKPLVPATALIGALAFLPNFKFLPALAGSIAFVVLAYLWYLQNLNRPLLLSYLGVSALSTVGGLQVAGLLTGTPYMLQAGQFIGTKASVFLPVLIIGLVLLNRAKPLNQIARDPVTWGTAAAAVLGLAALAFMNARTGNDNPAAVSGLELQFRNLLDQILPVRPRTKEFLIGHPALVLGLALAASKRPNPAVAVATIALVVSVIGQTSVVNTLCHLHTPVLLSLLRIVSGLALGGIFGFAAWFVLRAFWRDGPAPSEPS